MAFRLYVGNYPLNFTKEDVQSLFRDFDGVKVEKVCQPKGNSKCFSFLTCKDIDQLVSVIKKMNKTVVSGRNLIVRASDESLQEYVNLILQNDDCFSSAEQFVPVQVMRNKNRQPRKQNDSEMSYIHNKAVCEDVQNSFPKKEGNPAVSSNESTCSSGSMNNINVKKDGVNYYETSTCISSFTSKSTNSLNNQTNLKSNDNESCKNNVCFSKSPLNNHVQENDKNEFEECETSSSYSYKSSQSYCHTTGKSNMDSHKITSPESQKHYQLENERNNHQIKIGMNNFSECSYNNYGNNQIGLKSNDESCKNKMYFSKSPLNSHMREQDKSVHEEFETSSNYSPKSSHSYHNTEHVNIDSHKITLLESQKYYQSENKKNDHYQFKSGMNNFSDCSHNNYSDIDYQASEDKNAGHFCEQYDEISPTWVSVSNFRFGTHVRALWELFSDYEPLRVRIVCNEYRRNGALTEAHVCFPNRDIAEDVILNFDNTVFQGRIILVNDVEDLTILDELLSMSHL